jgi:predicted phosphodiesterase
MRLAVLSDIHGNLPALEAVIEDCTRAGANAFVNLGDVVSGPLWPAETADRLIELHWPTIAGNHERQVLLQPIEQQGASDRYASERLSSVHRNWLAGLPGTRWLAADLYCCHGTPTSDLQYFLETVTPDFGDERDGVPSHGARPATAQEALERAGTIPASLILCGHTHQARVLRLVDKRIVVNPGSVGLQAYDDELPFKHYIEAGTPHARYALIECDADTWKVQLRQVSYDHEAAARQAEANGRGDWADALRTGLVGRIERDVVN